MSTSVEEHVVALKFDAKQFQEGIKSTLASLDTLNKNLKLDGATKGITDVANAAKNVPLGLGHISSAIDGIASKFRTLSIVGITALTNIVNKAVDTGQRLIKSLTIDPIKSGFDEYELNLNSIQTILANTGLEGPKGLAKVTKALDELNRYSDETIYNFSEMAKNIGTFTAAGVSLNVATEAIKGIANLAAVSGANATKASAAMYQLSQAVASGKLTLEDWNSVQTADLGGKVFQESLKETARVHGVAIDAMIKENGSFRLSLQEGWLTSEILTETLSKFTGDLTAAQLKAMGYNQQQIAGILKMGKTAQDAATKVKTMSQLIDTLQSVVGSGWAQTWQTIFGDFDEARVLFTDVSNVLGEFIKTSSDGRNKLLSEWKDMGGRRILIDAISNSFHALLAILKPIKDAFRSIFPATTAQDLFTLTYILKLFTERLKIGADTADKLKRTFAGVFAVAGIGIDIIKELVKTIFRLLGVATEGSGGFLEFTANIGDFLVELRKAIKEGNGIAKIFKLIGDVLEVPLRLIGLLGTYLGGLFKNFDATAAVSSITGFVAKLEPITRLGDIITVVWGNIGTIFQKVLAKFLPMAERMIDFFHNLGDFIKDGIGDVDFSDLLGGVNTGLFAGLVLLVKSFLGGGGLGGIVESIKESFDALTGTLNSMQNTLRATTLLQLAIAIGILTLSVSALSKIDSAGLTRALAAMAVMFGQLFGAFLLFEKFLKADDILEMYAIIGAMTLLGIAIRVLTSSVKELSALSWEELGKGLGGVVVLMGAVIATAKLMPNPAGMISTAAGIVVLSAGIKILASAVTDLSGLSWQDLAKGLVGVGAILGGLVLFTKFAAVNAGGLAQGAGIILLATGIKILASAMQDFSKMSWEEIAKGIVALAGSLGIIGVALSLIPPTAIAAGAGVLILSLSLGMIADALAKMGAMSWGDIGRGVTAMAGVLTLISLALTAIPPTAPFAAAGVLIVAIALLKISDVLQQMGGMAWGEIGKAMVALAGSLFIIMIATTAMTSALPGAAAILIVAASLAILAPILQTFSKMSWGEMGKGLLMLAGVFVVLGLAGLILTPVVPTLIGLGLAVTLLGVGMLLAGAGVLAFSVGLTALSIAGAAGAAAMVAIVSAMIGLIPQVMEQIGHGLVAFAGVIATAGPAITGAIVTVLTALIDAIDTMAPMIITVLLKLLVLLLNELEKAVPKMVRAGYKMLIGILEGIRDNIQKASKTALEVIAKFIDGISEGLPKVIKSGVNLIISFVEGLAKAIRENTDRMNKAGRDLASAIIEGMAKGMLSGIGAITDAARNVAKAALNAAKDFLGINSPAKALIPVGMGYDEGFALGIDRFGHVVTKASENVGKEAIKTLSKSIAGISDVVSGDVNLSPIITPVLDLTTFKKDASLIGGMLATKPLSVEASYSQARSASSGYQNTQEQVSNEEPVSHTEQNLTFIQNNSSPKALSTSEIYRNTNNQISVAKGALAPKS